LDRQKKEYERERAAIKAKAAREKKATKLAAEKEERKKKGLPEPSRFVRASQPTISMFVRGSGNGKRVWQQMEDLPETNGEVSAVGEADSAVDENAPPMKRIALDRDCEVRDRQAEKAGATTKENTPEALRNVEDRRSHDPQTSSPVALKQECNQERALFEEHPCDDYDRGVLGAQTLKHKIAVEQEMESDDEFGEFPSLSQAVILEKIASSMGSIRDCTPALISPAAKIANEPEYDEESPQLRLRPSVPKQEAYDASLLDLFSKQPLCDDVEANRDILAVESENAPREPRSPRPPCWPIEIKTKQPASVSYLGNVKSSRPFTPFIRENEEKNQDPKPFAAPFSIQRPALQARSMNMPPPRRAVERAPSASFASPALEQNLTPRPKSVAFPYTAPPKFLLKDRTSKSTGPAQKPCFLSTDLQPRSRLATSLPPSGTQAFLETHFEDFFPSPTQEARELLEDADALPTNTQIARELSPPVKVIRYDVNKEIDFIVSTQDLIMSSQDMREIETPTSTPQPLLRKMAPPPPPVFKEKRRFFKEKEEDFKRAGLLQSSKEAVTKPKETEAAVEDCFPEDQDTLQAILQEGEKLEAERKAACALSNDYGSDEDSLLAAIGESEKLEAERIAACRPLTDSHEDDELFQLAILESERLAALEPERVKTIAISKPRRKFEEKEEDLLYAAIHESKILHTRQKHIPLNDDAPARESRTLKRASSGSTVYGDDEIISSQELLALF
jgi:hypothetical protein